jgi:hypothetical protein
MRDRPLGFQLTPGFSKKGGIGEYKEFSLVSPFYAGRFFAPFMQFRVG